MSFQIDPSFRSGRAKARKRHLKRRLIRFGLWGGAGLLAVALVAMIFSLVGSDGDEATIIVQPVEEQPAASDDDIAMVQTVEATPAEARPDASAAFVDLRRDPMILHLEQSSTSDIEQIPGPPDFIPTRAGPPGPHRISVLQDALFVGQERLMTTLPSSRDDFALFQAQRSRAMAEMTEGGATAQATVAEAGDVVTVAEDGSWGSFIAEDGASADAPTTEAAVYVETQIENTTSIAVALRELQRTPLFEDVIVVLQAQRPLASVLGDNGFDPDQVARLDQAAGRFIGVSGELAAGSIVAMRVRPEFGKRQLLQMSIYGPEGYVDSMAQIGAGRFASSADPWVEDHLMQRSGQMRQEATARQNVRLLDALYSAAIRGGLSTPLVGELIVIMSQRFDLDRFVAEGDRVTILFATEPGPEGQGVGQLLFAGIDGPSGKMPCYVLASDSLSGFGCFDFDAPPSVAETPDSLGGGIMVPVNGVKTSGFGPRLHPILKQVRNHDGVDWAAPTGTPVHAAQGGEVALAGDGGGYGNVVYIDHGGGVQSRYAHLDKFAPGLKAGQQVAAGDLIGYVGTTGRSTGPHLHFELRVAGAPVDPLTYGGVSTGGQPGSAAVEALVNQIIRVESAGNANARNPLSTATGLGQFIESTWLRMMRDYRPDLARSMPPAQLLALRTDPALSREMVRNLARENESFLRARGHQITPGRLYLAHFLGPAGADTALRADPTLTVLAVMGPRVVGANPTLNGKTIADLRAWSDRKMAGASAAPMAAAGPGGSAPPRPTKPVIGPDILAYRDRIDAILTGL